MKIFILLILSLISFQEAVFSDSSLFLGKWDLDYESTINSSELIKDEDVIEFYDLIKEHNSEISFLSDNSFVMRLAYMTNIGEYTVFEDYLILSYNGLELSVYYEFISENQLKLVFEDLPLIVFKKAVKP